MEIVANIYLTKVVLMLWCLVAVACQEVILWFLLGSHPFCRQWAGDSFHAMLAGVYRIDEACRENIQLVIARLWRSGSPWFTTVASHFSRFAAVCYIFNCCLALADHFSFKMHLLPVQLTLAV